MDKQHRKIYPSESLIEANRIDVPEVLFRQHFVMNYVRFLRTIICFIAFGFLIRRSSLARSVEMKLW